MNGVEYRNLCELAENRAITDEDSLAVSRLLPVSQFGGLTDADVALVALIRARAARAYHDGGPGPEAA